MYSCMGDGCQPVCVETCKQGGQDDIHVAKVAEKDVEQSIDVLDAEPVLEGANSIIGNWWPGFKPFEFSIVKDGPNWKTIGLVLRSSADNDCLVIDEVINIDSLVGEYNAATSDETLVRVGYVVRKINGARGVDNMLQALQSSGKGATVRFDVDPSRRNS
eukprot:TRINITY_DN65546_c0_g1_i1.p1 TRINITY_DN65546_c0_g1~~TRINITY_DN65546_c0_g1_i1.p1  ORF type:complete len:160 (+),score=21.26 TRINITY_DN65546_c0_g1_i1:61-540(+)